MSFLPQLEMPEPSPEPELAPSNEEEEEEKPEAHPVFEKKQRLESSSVFKKPVVLPVLSDSESSEEEDEVIVSPTPLPSPREVMRKTRLDVMRRKREEQEEQEEERYAQEAIPPPAAKREKRVQTERQKEALRRGREKSLATRRHKRDIKNTVTVKTQNEEKEIVEKIVKKDELKDLMLNTIVAYDTQKKEAKKRRKAEKKVEEEDQKAKDQLANTLKKAMNPRDSNDYWDACFNITY